jgi:hypothetical protein
VRDGGVGEDGGVAGDGGKRGGWHGGGSTCECVIGLVIVVVDSPGVSDVVV